MKRKTHKRRHKINKTPDEIEKISLSLCRGEITYKEYCELLEVRSTAGYLHLAISLREYVRRNNQI